MKQRIATTIACGAISLWAIGCGGDAATSPADGQAEATTSTPSADVASQPGAPAQPGTPQAATATRGTPPTPQPGVASATDGKRMRVRRADGKMSPLFQKVVVSKLGANIFTTTPGDGGDLVLPWEIFYRLKNDDGSEETKVGSKTFWRVGKPNGDHIGWIRDTHLTKWDTRFVLQPISPDQANRFRMVRKGGGHATHQKGKGSRTWCFIYKSPKSEQGDDTMYPIMLYAGKVETEGESGNLKREIDRSKNVILEIVFVVESSFLMNYQMGQITPAQAVANMAGQWVDLIKQDKSLQSVVKMGLVVFQDVSSGSAFGARTFVPLSSDFDRFRAAFSEIPNPLADAKAGKLTVLDDVWSQDTILGLDTAVSKVQWTPNSSKHIVLIGSAVPQLESDGNQKNPLGRPTNRIEEFFTNKEGSLFKFGWNSTGLTPRQVIQRATPAGGDDYEQAVGKKNLHAIAIAASGENFVMQHWQNVNKSTTEMNALLAKIKEARSVVTNDQIDAFKDKYAQNDAGLDAIIKRYLWELMDNTRPRTSAVYQEFTNNDGGDPGLFRDVAATEAATNAAVKDLGTSVTKAFALLKKTREGSVDSSSDELKRKEDTDNLGSSFWKIVDASGKILKDDGVQLGEAPVRNEEGVKWAEKKVMIGGDELDKLVSSLSGMHDKFKNMVKKSKRQDVSDVLNELKALAATATTGQAFTADSSLASVLTDLPLRTSALTTTPKSLAVMSGPDFKAWLSKIDAAIRRCRDIKDGRAGNSWFALSSYSPNAKFTVLKLTELP